MKINAGQKVNPLWPKMYLQFKTWDFLVFFLPCTELRPFKSLTVVGGDPVSATRSAYKHSSSGRVFIHLYSSWRCQKVSTTTPVSSYITPKVVTLPRLLLHFSPKAPKCKLVSSFLGATQMYNFPEELREVVNDHWSQFPPQHPLVADFFGILFLILTVVNFIANSLVIYVYLGTPELRTPVSIWLYNTAS